MEFLSVAKTIYADFPFGLIFVETPAFFSQRPKHCQRREGCGETSEPKIYRRNRRNGSWAAILSPRA